MNLDDTHNFLIKKETGAIFQTKKVREDSIIIERLGDFKNKEIKKHRIENSYHLIDKKVEKDIWESIYQFIKNEIQKYNPCEHVFIYSSTDEMITPVHLKELNDPDYEAIDRIVEELAIKSFRKTNKDSDADNILKNTKRKRILKKKNSMKKNDLLPEDMDTESDADNFIIINPDPVADKLDSIILHPKTKETIDQVLVQFELGDFFKSEWSTNRINKDNKSALNFYGPPGTGKTITAKSIANYFNKSILQVDYSMLMSKYVGGTGKNIKKCFDKAKNDDLILFFDEADALLQKRNSDSSNSSINNQNQINFMQELDRFEGIIILTTNHFENYDAAQFRRFRHVEFFLPTTEMREQIIKDHIPPNVKISKDLNYKVLSEITENFSGGDIKNLIENVLKNFAMETRKRLKNETLEVVKQALRDSSLEKSHFLSEIEKINEAKKNFDNKLGSNPKRKIGFFP